MHSPITAIIHHALRTVRESEKCMREDGKGDGAEEEEDAESYRRAPTGPETVRPVVVAVLVHTVVFHVCFHSMCSYLDNLSLSVYPV